MATLREGREKMQALCEAEGLLCLNVTEVLIKVANQGQQLFYRDDNHMNAAGNAILTEIVWEFTVQEDLVEPLKTGD